MSHSSERSAGVPASSPVSSSSSRSDSAGSPHSHGHSSVHSVHQHGSASPSVSTRRVLQERHRSSSNNTATSDHSHHSRQSHRHHSGQSSSSSNAGQQQHFTASSTFASSSPAEPSSSPTHSSASATVLPSPAELKHNRSASSPYTISSPFPIRLPDYSEAIKIFESKHTVVYHATRVSDGVDVVLKLPNSKQPGRARLLVFGQQFDLLKSIEAQGRRITSEPSSGASLASGQSSPSVSTSTVSSSGAGSAHSHSLPAYSSLSEGVIRAYDLISMQSTLILVCEYFNGPSLHSYLSTSAYSNGFPLIEFLCLGIKLSHVLYDVHQQNIIHKDITASNILYNRQTRQIKIIGQWSG